MNDRDALLAAILAEPDEDTPRLVYADWLDENGQGDRAAFVRAQVEAARVEPFGPQARAATLRADELLNRNWKEWTATIRDLVAELRFERGFVTEVAAEPRAFLGVADEVFAAHPVQALRLDPHSNPDFRTAFAPVFDLASVKPLRRLAFARQTEFWDEDYQALAHSAHLAGLTDLAFPECRVDVPWLEDVLRGDSFPALAGLDVSDSTNLGPCVAEALAESRHRDLRRLDLSGVYVTSDDLQKLLVSRCLRRLEELRLGWLPGRKDGGPLFHMDIGWVIPWERLVVLDLARQRLGNEGVKEIVRKPECAALRWLGLADNALTREGVRMLAAAKHLNLHHLDVRGNWLHSSDIAALRDRYPDAVVLG
jgi:uncharacterized protein (TIGR02996 family)